jgi:hypothetical protein
MAQADARQMAAASAPARAAVKVKDRLAPARKVMAATRAAQAAAALARRRATGRVDAKSRVLRRPIIKDLYGRGT